MREKKAFTFIEVLVVLIVIAIISSAGFVIYSKSRRHARDAARVSDVAQLQVALAAYHRDLGVYPSVITLGTTFSAGSTVYMNQIPTYPKPVDAPCPANSTYTYTPGASYLSYAITFCISSPVSNLSPGQLIATPAGIGQN